MRILYIGTSAPLAIRSGGAQRTNLLLNALKTRHQVDSVLLVDQDQFSDEEMEILRNDYGMKLVAAPYPVGYNGMFGLLRRCFPAATDWLVRLWDRDASYFKVDPFVKPRIDRVVDPKDYDLVVYRYLRAAAIAGVPCDIPTLVDIDDLDTEILRRRLERTNISRYRRWLTRVKLRRIEKNIRPFLQRFSWLWHVTPAEREKLGFSNSSVLPNVSFFDFIDLPRPERRTDAGPVVAFIGSFYYHVNTKAVGWFVDEVWPRILERVPAARFEVYGPGLPSYMETRLASIPGVKVCGYVKDVADAYRGSSVMVCPVWEGGGTNIKVIEAAAHCRLCVVSTVGARGFEEDPSVRDVLPTASDSASFADLVSNYLEDEALNREHTEAFRRGFQRAFSKEDFAEEVLRSVDRVISERVN